MRRRTRSGEVAAPASASARGNFGARASNGKGDDGERPTLRPLRVLHVDTERGWRGGERQTLWLAREMAARGHAAFIAARPGEPLAARARAAALPVVACSPKFEGDPVAALKLRRVIRKMRIDVVHAHAAHAVSVGASATIGTAVPLVVSRRVDFRLRDNAATRWKYGRATKIVAISRAVADVLAACGIPAGRIAVVPDATDVHREVAPAAPDLLRELGVPEGVPLVVQVAQLVGHKDPVNFVRAVAAARRAVPALHALLVGEGPLRDDVAREVEAQRLGDALHLTGYRTDADALLAAADVAVLSSREEGMGSVLLDALLFGRAIAATRAGGIPEVIEHDRTGLLAPIEDPESLGACIARLLTDPALAARLRTAARSHAANFSVERMTDRTLEIYERVLTG